MAKTGIDALLKAIETVGYLEDTAENQEKSIAAMTSRLDRLEKVPAALQATSTGCANGR